MHDDASDSVAEARTRGALRSLNAERMEDEGFDVGRASRATLSAIVGAGYRRAVLALSTEDFTRVRARMGEGVGHDILLRSFIVRLSNAGGPLGKALVARESLFADMDSQASKPLRGDRLLRDLQPKSFGLLPLVVEDRLVGCLYFDDPIARVQAGFGLRQLLEEIRDHLVATLAKHKTRLAS